MLLQMSHHECRDPLHEADRHSEGIACLGSAYAEAAVTGTECPHCESMSLTLLHSCIAFFHRGSPPQPASHMSISALLLDASGLVSFGGSEEDVAADNSMSLKAFLISTYTPQRQH